MITNENFIELNNNFYTKCKKNARIFNLLTIPTFLFGIILAGYFGYFPLKVEFHSVILIGFIYFIYLFFIRHNAYYASCKFKSQYLELTESLKNYINNNQLKIADTSKANGNIDDFLKEFTSNIRNTNFSSIASGIFPTLGILGTFISIAFSMPDFSSGTSSALEQEITILLGGVGTAFYVSIYGIFLSIWWIFFEKIGMSRFEHDALIIKENTKSFFWTKLDIESIHLQTSMKNFEKMTQLFEQISSQDLINNINNSLEKRASMVESIIKEETLLVDNIKSNIQNFDNLFELVKQMTLSIQTNVENLNTQNSINEKITESLNNSVQSLSNSLSNLDSTNVKDIYENVIQNINTMKDETDRIGWKLSKELNEYDVKFTQKLENSLEAIDSQTVKIIENLKEFQDISK